jgi:hypothetical protein
MKSERSLDITRTPSAGGPARRGFGPKALALAMASAILLLGGCVAYQRDDHYHGRKGWNSHHYNHFDGHQGRGRDGWRRR